MKKQLKLTIMFLTLSNILYAQEEENIKVFLETDIGFSSSANDTRNESSSGVGTLGLKFKQNFFYGNVNFTVHSENQEIKTIDSTETKLFGTNLLLPKNSSSNISNFSIILGTSSFYNYDSVSNSEPLLSWKRFGAEAFFNINNTTWIKDTLSIPTTINSFGINATYLLLNLEFLQSEDRIKLLISFGYTARRLGGDYGVEINKPIRKQFIGTDKLGFDGANLGFRLEIGKFYGQMNLTSFQRKENILGFSGNQAIVSLGIKADLKIAAKNTKAE